jgi:N-glycosylase/DNA lyase
MGEWTLPRFSRRIANFLATSMRRLYSDGGSIRKLLRETPEPHTTRRVLIANVKGFGPKQASLFLRRIGYCTDLAVLDTHVVDYLRLVHGMTIRPYDLARLSAYEAIEVKFRQIADQLGYSVGHVDSATWLTMRVVKREVEWRS